MKEVVDRLTERRQLELAKSILESRGYIVRKRVNESNCRRSRKMNEASNDGYTWSNEWVKEPGNPYRMKYYSKEGNDIIGIIYEPDKKEFTDYGADIYDNSKADVVSDDDYADGFVSEEDAKKWVENWFRKKGGVSEGRGIRESSDQFDKIFRKFNKSDAYGYAGALPLPDGTGPFIYEDDIASILVACGDDDDSILVSIYGDDELGYYGEYDTKEEAMSVALDAYNQVSKGSDPERVAHSLGFNRF